VRFPGTTLSSKSDTGRRNERRENRLFFMSLGEYAERPNVSEILSFRETDVITRTSSALYWARCIIGTPEVNGSFRCFGSWFLAASSAPMLRK
jgi:hypothetical protein